MNKTFMRVILLALSFVLLFNASNFIAYASARTLVYNRGEWKVYLDSPDSAKPYYHLHFYKKGKHIYCLRLDNMQPCDSTAGNKDKVPKSVMEAVHKHSKVKDAVAHHFPTINNGWVKAIVKPLLIAGAAVIVVVAAVNIFTGPIDDVAAWAALAAAVNW